jgi:nicotinamide phosphoribosyltransferase
MSNLILRTDSYKLSHWRQLPPGTTHLYSYLESRGGAYSHTVFFGLQGILMKHLVGKVLLPEHIDEAYEFARHHFGDASIFNLAGFRRLYDKHQGRLPVSIRSVPEGYIVPTGNVLMTIENTDPEFPWLTNYLETVLLQLWYPITVATTSLAIKNTIKRYLELTGTPELIDYKLHDFGFRGVSSVESAGIGGAAHLTAFRGTDTIEAIQYLKTFYAGEMTGFSIPAAEHSTITSWGQENEAKAYENMLDQFPGMVAVVSDSYDIYAACDAIWGGVLHDKVAKRQYPLVIRPDSGYPPNVVLNVLNTLKGRFGARVNDKGYQVLPDNLRVIQGDGIDHDMIEKILSVLDRAEWSADNVAFGMGGALLQKLDRDTLKFAIKCSSITVNGKEQDVFKQPKTESWKRSKRGRLKLVLDDEGVYRTVGNDNSRFDALSERFRDGALARITDIDLIRSNIEERRLLWPEAVA